MRAVLPLRIAALLIALSAISSVAAQSDCEIVCINLREETISGCAAQAGRAGCVETAKTARAKCLTHLKSCLGGCQGNADGKPGACNLTRECAEKCRRKTSSRQGCKDLYESKLRRKCGRSCVHDAETVKGCVRRHIKQELACDLPPTTTTSSTSTSVTTSSSTSTTEGPVVTTSTSTTTTTSTSTTLRPLSCNDCVLEIAGQCYIDCQDNCNNDVDAIDVCHRACRNQRCEQIRNQCDCEEDSCKPITVPSTTIAASVVSAGTTTTTIATNNR